jgi:hypothetical protein
MAKRKEAKVNGTDVPVTQGQGWSASGTGAPLTAPVIAFAEQHDRGIRIDVKTFQVLISAR